MSSPAISPEEFTSAVYDYIVVGGGTAGLVVAARYAWHIRSMSRTHSPCRLSENPDVTVAVIEAGGWDPTVPGVNIPGEQVTHVAEQFI